MPWTSADAHFALIVIQEAYNDALYFKDEALRAFKLGILSLEERAQVRLIQRFTVCACERGDDSDALLPGSRIGQQFSSATAARRPCPVLQRALPGASFGCLHP